MALVRLPQSMKLGERVIPFMNQQRSSFQTPARKSFRWKAQSEEDRGQAMQAPPIARDEIQILITERVGSSGIALLEKVGRVECSYNLSETELLEKVPYVDALVVRSKTYVTRQLFAASNGRLKVVGRAGVGVDNIDIPAATEAGCLVVNAPTANTLAAAEHAVALLYALSRNLAQGDASMKAGRWESSKYTGISLVDKTLAVMGLGKVGAEVARIASGLGMKVVAHDPYALPGVAHSLGVELLSFNDALAQGDFVSLHIPLTRATCRLFNSVTLSKMKQGAYIINVARGGVIDEADLAAALDEGRLRGAALDVFEVTPPAPDNILVCRSDVVCTPRLSVSTKEAKEGVAVEIAGAVAAGLRGEPCATALNAPRVSGDELSLLQPYAELAELLGRATVQMVHGRSVQVHDLNAQTHPRADGPCDATAEEDPAN
ncbi:D-isomer specific 2-hydroxyacid dehydrogenase, partial [Cymbomonas tetramitiformis]